MEKENDISRFPIWIVPVLFATVIAACLAYPYLLARFRPDLTCWEQIGQFGDSFGALNTLFSGLAFAGVICALWMQREELALQRQELRETRKVLQSSAEAQVRISRLSALTALVDAHSSVVSARDLETRAEMASMPQSKMRRYGQSISSLQLLIEELEVLREPDRLPPTDESNG